MEAILQAIVLGIVQGLTEFLPISSSGHLELARFYLDMGDNAQDNLFMTVALHAATALSTVLVFRKEVGILLQALFRLSWNEETRFVRNIVVSMIPAGLVGLLLEEQISALFDRQIPLVSLMLMLTGVLLFWADRARQNNRPVGLSQAWWIGIAQAIAIIPGISRSGATIGTALLLGVDRERAARFSFLMVVPLILGKMLLDILDGDVSNHSIGWMPLVAGFAAAFLTGVLACVWMIRLVRRSKLWVFALYCVGIASLSLFVYYS
ncbi:MAG: undecaprenyl-diphosphate phosphatase [Saprospiraceae bacterium]|jgi:undecaprenyl-diphosphatase|nr:undecaprenyl-diphosphate phosphatase [Saprospiraceae bacterium]MDP4820314.1 undecaprenyl-diphosphate phosphatase [Saprospiraceae bacterium]MDP4997841.1 undecaprenyl-diphosphate phosphatase [Saprospiraceae bacterium]